jgi:DNA-binding response OmpR family regulator
MEQQPQQVFEFGAFRLNVAEQKLSRAGAAVPLTPKAFDLLLAFLTQPGHLLEN